MFFTALIGAAIGAIVGAAISIGTQLAQGKTLKTLDWRSVAGSAAQGAVTGGVAGLTLGAGALIPALGTRVAIAAGTGVVGGLLGLGANSAITGQVPTKGQVIATVVAGALGGGLGGAFVGPAASVLTTAPRVVAFGAGTGGVAGGAGQLAEEAATGFQPGAAGRIAQATGIGAAAGVGGAGLGVGARGVIPGPIEPTATTLVRPPAPPQGEALPPTVEPTGTPPIAGATADGKPSSSIGIKGALERLAAGDDVGSPGDGSTASRLGTPGPASDAGPAPTEETQGQGANVATPPPSRGPPDATKPNLNTALGDSPFEGPAPVRTPLVSDTELQAAVARLRAGTATDADAEAVVQRAVTDARKVLLRNSTSPDNDLLQGACGFSSCLIARQLERFGVPADVKLFQAADAIGGNSYRHAFDIVNIGGKRFLVDATFRQFFNPNSRGTNQVGYPGTFMRSTPAGSAIADQIIGNGYAELTDPVAREYANALSTGNVPEMPSWALGTRGSWPYTQEFEPAELDQLLDENGATPPLPQP